MHHRTEAQELIRQSLAKGGWAEAEWSAGVGEELVRLAGGSFSTVKGAVEVCGRSGGKPWFVRLLAEWM